MNKFSDAFLLQTLNMTLMHLSKLQRDDISLTQQEKPGKAADGVIKLQIATALCRTF